MVTAAGFAVAWWTVWAQALPCHSLRRVEQGQGQGQWPEGFEPPAVEPTPPPLPPDLPRYADFEADYIRRHNAELFDVNDQIPPAAYPNMRTLIVGVWTMPWQSMYRSTVRTTWMDMPMVCPLHQGPRTNCQIYTTFVIATPGDGQPLSGSALSYFDQARSEPDMVVLATTEKNKHAKIFDFFQRAASENPWATHFAKVNLEVYIYVPQLLRALAEQKDCVSKFEVIGVPAICNATEDEHCDMPDWLPKQCPQLHTPAGCRNSKECSAAKFNYCRHYRDHFDFVRGHFLLVSRPLALRATDPKSSLMSKRLKLGAREKEEHAMSRSMLDAAWADDTCIHFWEAEGVYHPRFSPDVRA